MSISLPSREIYAVDVPEPVKFEVDFLYNFFVPNEGKSETGGISDKYLKRPSSELGSDFIDYASTRVPRFNVLKWALPHLSVNESSEMAQRQKNNESSNTKNLIATNLKKIVTENDLSSFDYFSVLLDDPEIDSKIFNYVSASALHHLFGDDDNDVSHYKTAMRLGAKLPSYVDLEFLKTGMGQLDKSSGVQFTDKQGAALANNKLAELKSVNVFTQLNSTLAHGILARSVMDPHSPYTLEFQELLDTTSRLTAYMRQKAITGIDENDFKAFVPYVDVRASSKQNTQHTTTARIVGFIIDKLEHLPNGTTKIHDQIIIENPKIHVTTDLRVKYGSTYSYAIRTIVLFTLPAIDDETDDVASISFLVSSRPSNRVVLTCIDTFAPPPPTDINFTWDYGTEKMMVHWMFPPNSQRDIKEFQVFRRQSVRDPFELIKVYRFNDAAVKNELTIHNVEDDIDESLIEDIENPTTVFIDDDFEKSSKFIYTVCCIDAHGQTSNYGAQYQLGFDVFKNRLTKKLISHTGAPKAYPNLYVQADLFQDTIRVSGPHSKRLKVYFNPEFYSIIDNKNRKNDVVTTKQHGGSYTLQFINIDRQKSTSIKIQLDDQRKATNHVPREKLTER
jgi:hypothetical protein